MLDFNSLNALRHEPSDSNHAIRLEPDLADAEISGSCGHGQCPDPASTGNETGGLKLTATGKPIPRRSRGDARDHPSA
jgi:hypothetical protein